VVWYFVGSISNTYRFRFVPIKELALFGPLKGLKIDIFKNLLMNHWPECIEIWHGESLGLGDTDLFI